jgi:cysteine desulfurase / selenocysteine lyase
MRQPKPFDPEACHGEFPLLADPPGGKPIHYLDSAATAQVPAAVLRAVRRHETMTRANVLRGVYFLAEAATNAYEAARASVAGYLGVADPAEVIFTGGTTASINLIAHSFGASLAAGDEILLSELEHHSNIVPWQMLAERRGVILKVLPVTEEGRLDLDKLDRLLTRRCKLVALTHASNVTGAVTDVGRVVEAARSVGAKLLLDGAQRAPHGPLDLPALGIDFYAFSSHKLYGPTGVGVLWGRRALLEAMPPFMGGGGMIERVSFQGTSYAGLPRRFEAGTPPIAEAIGLGAAVEWAKSLDWAGVAAHEARLAGRILDGLGAIKGARLVGPAGLQNRLGVVAFAIDGLHPHDVCQWLDRRNVALRGGHHCAQPLMARFGLAGTTRASLAPYNIDADVDALLAGLDEAVAKLA